MQFSWAYLVTSLCVAEQNTGKIILLSKALSGLRWLVKCIEIQQADLNK